MKKWLIGAIIAFGLILPNSGLSAEKWSKINIGLEMAYYTLHLIDFSQTLQIADNPEQYYEINPFLGSHPSREKVYLSFAITSVGHFLISHYLKEPYRTGWQTGTIVLYLPIIAGNFQIGLGFRF